MYSLQQISSIYRMAIDELQLDNPQEVSAGVPPNGRPAFPGQKHLDFTGGSSFGLRFEAKGLLSDGKDGFRPGNGNY